MFRHEFQNCSEVGPKSSPLLVFDNFALNVLYMNKIGKGLGAGVGVETGGCYRFSPAGHLCREAPCKFAVLKLPILHRLQ